MATMITQEQYFALLDSIRDLVCDPTPNVLECLRKERDDLKVQYANLQKRADQLERRNNKLYKERRDWRNRCTSLEHTRDALDKALWESKELGALQAAELERWQTGQYATEQVAELENLNTALNQENDRLVAHNKRLRTERDMRRADVDRLERELAEHALPGYNQREDWKAKYEAAREEANAHCEGYTKAKRDSEDWKRVAVNERAKRTKLEERLDAIDKIMANQYPKRRQCDLNHTEDMGR